MSDRNSNGSSTRTAACPTCGKPAVRQFRPFCSKRCADVDLGRWLKGAYAIPVAEAEDEDGETPGGGRGGDDQPPPVRH
jgi:endogenous inhibitor of DNA gyrase (YacG/DUF329 family)